MERRQPGLNSGLIGDFDPNSEPASAASNDAENLNVLVPT